MDTIKSIFNNRLFRIPDYQRGYSWERIHLNDFWQDIINLQDKKVHYTGMISVELVDPSESDKWLEDQWIIGGKGDLPYFIVDGQQRLTTIMILIWTICQKMSPGSQLSYNTREDIIEKYIYTTNEIANQKSYLFGYHKDNPSYEFLKREIFEQTTESSELLEQTVYTNNLWNAKRFFIEKMKKFTDSDLQVLFHKVTQQLKFDFRILEKELDIFIVFETMNNRGKPLSNLEKLKNRLIYLSTLLKGESIDRKVELRDSINDKWKIIYKYLGLNKDQKLDDDLFLQNHWIMFKRYDRREPEFYANDLFDRYYTSQNVLAGLENYSSITNYINSIAESARQWFVMNSPHHPHAYDIAGSRSLLIWLRKLNRLGFKSFAPLILGALVVHGEPTKLVTLLKSIEAYIFLIFYVSFKRSNTGTYHFFSRASELYNGETSIDLIIEDVNLWIYGRKDFKGYFDISGFQSYLKDLFQQDSGNGYYDWKFLRYFLFEYDVHKKADSELPSVWTDLNSVQHIYPNDAIATCWKESFRNYTTRQKRILSGSLGNFILVNRGGDSQSCFDEKKVTFSRFNNTVDLQDVVSWNEQEILNRGLEMLNFMERRWNIYLGDDSDKIKLLFLDFSSDDNISY